MDREIPRPGAMQPNAQPRGYQPNKGRPRYATANFTDPYAFMTGSGSSATSAYDLERKHNPATRVFVPR